MDRAPAPFLSARDKLALFRSIALLGFALLDQKKKDTNTHTQPCTCMFFLHALVTNAAVESTLWNGVVVCVGCSIHYHYLSSR